MKCHDFPNASYLTTFVCCRVNTVVHVIKAVFDSAPLFTACLNISKQPTMERGKMLSLKQSPAVLGCSGQESLWSDLGEDDHVVTMFHHEPNLYHLSMTE